MKKYEIRIKINYPEDKEEYEYKSIFGAKSKNEALLKAGAWTEYELDRYELENIKKIEIKEIRK